MFQTLIRPSSGACDYLLRCVGWLEACWCCVAGLSVGDVVFECRLNHYYTRIPHHQQTIPLHNTRTPQVSLHNTTSSRKLLNMDVLTSETCWAVDKKASVIKLVNLYSKVLSLNYRPPPPPMALQPNEGHCLLIHEVSRSHITTLHRRYESSGRMISPSQRPLPDNTQYSTQISMPPARFETTIPASERP